MSAFHAAVAATLLAAGVGMTAIGRTWPTRRRDQVGPAADLIPAFAGGWPTVAFRDCVLCRATVPVTVHHGAHRCDQGHTTVNTTTGSAL